MLELSTFQLKSVEKALILRSWADPGVQQFSIELLPIYVVFDWSWNLPIRGGYWMALKVTDLCGVRVALKVTDPCGSWMALGVALKFTDLGGSRMDLLPQISTLLPQIPNQNLWLLAGLQISKYMTQTQPPF